MHVKRWSMNSSCWYKLKRAEVTAGWELRALKCKSTQNALRKKKYREDDWGKQTTKTREEKPYTLRQRGSRSPALCWERPLHISSEALHPPELPSCSAQPSGLPRHYSFLLAQDQLCSVWVTHSVPTKSQVLKLFKYFSRYLTGFLPLRIKNILYANCH